MNKLTFASFFNTPIPFDRFAYSGSLNKVVTHLMRYGSLYPINFQLYIFEVFIMSFMSNIPILGSVIDTFGNIGKVVESMFNSPEHNFKKALHSMLDKVMGPEEAKKVQKFLDSGKDEQLGERLRTLMASGVIPPEMAPQLAQLAQQMGVSKKSIDPNELQRPMEEFELEAAMNNPEFEKAFPGKTFQVLQELSEKKEQEKLAKDAEEEMYQGNLRRN